MSTHIGSTRLLPMPGKVSVTARDKKSRHSTAPGRARIRRPNRRAEAGDRPAKITLPLLSNLTKVGGSLKEMRAIIKFLKKSDLRHKSELYESLARTYHLAGVLKRDRDSWLEFCREDFWKDRRIKPKPDQPDASLRFLVKQIVARGKSDAPRKMVQSYYAALRELRARRTKAEDVIDALVTQGGVKGLSAAYAMRRNGRDPLSKDVSGRSRLENATSAKINGTLPPSTPHRRRVTIVANDFLRWLEQREAGKSLKVRLNIVEKKFGSMKIEIDRMDIQK